MSSDLQRYVLLAGLLIVGYMLVLAWSEDYSGVAENGAVSANADPIMSAPDVPSAAADPAVASAPVDTDGSAADVPVDVPALSANVIPDVTTASTAAGPGEGLVRVRTDTLNLWIDRRGGDIVKVTLPTFPQDIETPDAPFVLLDRSADFTYVAQSGLTGPDGVDTAAGRALYASAHDEYELADGQQTLDVILSTERDGMAVRKRFRFQRGDHLVLVSYLIDNATNASIDVTPYAQLKRSPGQAPGVETSGMGPRPFVGPALTTAETRYEKLDFDDLEDEPYRADVDGGWIAMLQHYFLSAWIPAASVQHRYYARPANDGTFLAGFTGPALRIAAGSAAEVDLSFYAGPKIQERLERIAPNLNLTVDYGFLWWLADPLFDLLEWFHSLVRNWGFAIILLTFTVKLLLYPLSAAGYRSMANMRKVAPDLKRLQERYSDDRQKLSTEMMNLYKKEKINPLGGCLPMVLQMPVFLSLYWVLYESVELRQAPFVLWIEDMSKMDPFFVLPLAMGATMWFQMKLNPAPPDPMQAKVMQIMPVMFTVLFLFFPAGLVLYWLVNSVLSISQQWYITRRIERGARA